MSEAKQPSNIAECRTDFIETKLKNKVNELDILNNELTVERDRLAAIIKEAEEQEPIVKIGQTIAFINSTVNLYAHPSIPVGWKKVPISRIENMESFIHDIANEVYPYPEQAVRKASELLCATPGKD